LTHQAREELIKVAHDWDRAMLANDADAIGRFMADDWSIVGPDGRGWEKAPFLDLVRSGTLTHDVMTSEDIDIRVYGDAAIVRAHGVSGGTMHGQPFRVEESATSVFVRQGGEWKCVLTHLAAIPK
jgi:ketosteroid isomerase-like protein